MKPKISIIIPSFNKADFIQQTLDSVRNQDFKEWEVIVVDDGSTDNSVSIIHNNCQKDHRLRLIRRKEGKGGGSSCRNIGIQHASGDYIMFLDADDVLAPHCLNMRMEKIKTYPHCDFWVFSTGTFYQKIGDRTSVWRPRGQNFLLRFLSHDLPWNIMSVTWQKEYLYLLEGFDPEYERLQDVELHTRALFEDNVLLKTFPQLDPDAYYRVDEDRMIFDSTTFIKKWIQGVTMYVEKTLDLIERYDNNKSKLRKKLKGTVLTTMTNLLSRHVNNQVDDLHFEIFKNQLLLSAGVTRLFTSNEYHIINAYVLAYRKGLYKIKGFNFVVKKIISN